MVFYKIQRLQNFSQISCGTISMSFARQGSLGLAYKNAIFAMSQCVEFTIHQAFNCDKLLTINKICKYSDLYPGQDTIQSDVFYYIDCSM